MQCIIHTPTNKIENSLDFYKRLNFKLISNKNLTLVSDGKALIEINPDRFARAGIKLFKNSWKEEIKQLEKLTAAIPNKNGLQLTDPNGVWIYLVENTLDIDYKAEEKCYGLTGNFNGLSLETSDMVKSMEFYSILGFSQSNGSIEHGWLSLDNNGFFISLMKAMLCPHLFFNPSMTYFNGKENMAVIEKIRATEIPIAEEITYFNKEGVADNIIIRDPGGYGFFIFND